MTEYGVTNTGFVKKEYNNIIESLHSNAKKGFGRDVDLTPGSPIKLLIDVYAFQIVNLWNQLEACYNASFLETATGYALDNLGKLVGAERGSATYATGHVTFFRNAVMADGSPSIIKVGTKVSTADILANEYITTESVYFQPTITNEAHLVNDTSYTVDATNIIGSIVTITDSNNVTYSNVVVDGRTITFLSQIDAGTTVYITYKPLSVTAPVVSVLNGASSNVAANVITILNTPIGFIHYISNEVGIDTGSDVESDSHFRNTIINATQGVGRATTKAIKYYLSQVTGVKTVVIDDPLRVTTTQTIAANGSASFFINKLPLYAVSSVIGSINGAYIIESFNTQTGEVQLTTLTDNAETLTVSYTYFDPGKIKIYVEGGTTGDEFTPDTIVYTIENTRAAGIQSIGYDSGDPGAEGSPTAKFSWFYRPNNAYIDINITIYFDSESDLTETDKSNILITIQDIITDYINELELGEKVYKNKILQLVISANKDILDAELTGWQINDLDVDVNSSYIQIGSMEVAISQNIILTHNVA
jgi:uncharacterized phage protein gp47/JayE